MARALGAAPGMGNGNCGYVFFAFLLCAFSFCFFHFFPPVRAFRA